jgi:hypothetical protein
MARLVVLTGAIVCLALSACGGGNDSSSTTAPPDQTAVRWSRCPISGRGESVAGISCRARGARPYRFPAKNITGSAGRIRHSDPLTFRGHGFDCTQFPLEDGFGWHIVCARGEQHVSFYSTP